MGLRVNGHSWRIGADGNRCCVICLVSVVSVYDEAQRGVVEFLLDKYGYHYTLVGGKRCPPDRSNAVTPTGPAKPERSYVIRRRSVERTSEQH